MTRLINAAVVSPAFRELLLNDPETALARGYNGEQFHLSPEERELVFSIHVTTLADFAAQLIQGVPPR